jgi:hypothetical protein
MRRQISVCMALVMSVSLLVNCDRSAPGVVEDPATEPSGETNKNTDQDVCGDGLVTGKESCDSAIVQGNGACPVACADAKAWTNDELVGSGCERRCVFTVREACTDQTDGLCVDGCTAETDRDCLNPCGNGIVDAGELCDTGIASGKKGACPTDCDDKIACTQNFLAGIGCNARCESETVDTCDSEQSDGCCPQSCDQTSDLDCQPTCGDGVLDPGELCDTGVQEPGLGACPTTCDDNVACTKDTVVGGGCGATCKYTPITSCSLNSDGCCAAGCNASNDADCSPTCGNGIVEPGENCDTALSPPAQGACLQDCDDNINCTLDFAVGAGCTASCAHSIITQCVMASDGCCPVGCDATNDGDCKPRCGNGVLEGTEKCDKGIAAGLPGACPTSCNDGNVCTDDLPVNSACNVVCSFKPIDYCKSGDGCCPAGCTAGVDNDCIPDCGNSVAEGTEQCDFSDLRGATCASLGLPAGTLGCSLNCTLNVNGCLGTTAPPAQAICGDGKATGNEACDGADLGGRSCINLGFLNGGFLACRADCMGFDLRNCNGGLFVHKRIQKLPDGAPGGRD